MMDIHWNELMDFCKSFKFDVNIFHRLQFIQKKTKYTTITK